MDGIAKVENAKKTIQSSLFTFCQKNMKKQAAFREWNEFQILTRSVIPAMRQDNTQTFCFSGEYLYYSQPWLEQATQDEVTAELKAHWGNRWAEEIVWNVKVPNNFTAGIIKAGYVDVTNRFGERKYVYATNIADDGWDNAYYDATPMFKPEGPVYHHVWRKLEDPPKLEANSKWDEDVPF